jgi:type I restriction enzyme R subunit
MTRWTEEARSELPAVRLLRALGYVEVSAEALESERTSHKSVILEARLGKALRRLNPWLDDSGVAKAVKAIANVAAVSLAEANEQLYNHLTYGLAIDADRGTGRKGHTVRFFDFAQPSNDEFLVVRQYPVLGSKKHIYPDITCFVNGLPLAVIECKNPTKGEKWREQAIRQLRRYQEADRSGGVRARPSCSRPCSS